MRFLFLLLLLPFGLRFCDSQKSEAPKEKPFPVLGQPCVDAVVRLDMGERFRGNAVVVTPSGYAVTSLSILSEYKFWKYRVELGSDHVPGTIVAVDEKRGLALIKASRPLGVFATLASPGASVDTRAPAFIVAYSELDSTPPLLEKRPLLGSMDDSHKRLESTGPFAPEDATYANASGVGSRQHLHSGGAGVFMPEPDRLVGVVVGTAMHESSSSTGSTGPLLVLPADVLRAFLKENRVALPAR